MAQWQVGLQYSTVTVCVIIKDKQNNKAQKEY